MGTFLGALASLDSKLSVSQSVIDVFRLAHLRVFQSYFTCSHWVFLSPNINSICTYMLVPLSVWITFFLFVFLFVFYIFNIFVCSPLSSPCHFGELLCSTYFHPFLPFHSNIAPFHIGIIVNMVMWSRFHDFVEFWMLSGLVCGEMIKYAPRACPLQVINSTWAKIC